jgi:hypothetical protein
MAISQEMGLFKRPMFSVGTSSEVAKIETNEQRNNLCDTDNRGYANKNYKTKQTNFVASVRERTMLTERSPLVNEVSVNFLQIEGYRVVGATDPYGRNSG